jgi:hypothetical protein
MVSLRAESKTPARAAAGGGGGGGAGAAPSAKKVSILDLPSTVCFSGMLAESQAHAHVPLRCVLPLWLFNTQPVAKKPAAAKAPAGEHKAAPKVEKKVPLESVFCVTAGLRLAVNIVCLLTAGCCVHRAAAADSAPIVAPWIPCCLFCSSQPYLCHDTGCAQGGSV